MVAELGRSPMVKSGLNPLAAEFIPGSSARQAVHKHSSDSSPPSDNKGFGQLPDEVSLFWTCLPQQAVCQDRAGSTFCAALQVLATVLSCLEQPRDVLACAAASSHIRDIAEHAPLELCICLVPKACAEVLRLQQILQTITRHFKGKFAQGFFCCTAEYPSCMLSLQVCTPLISATQGWMIQTSVM